MILMKLQETTKVMELLAAEHRLQGEGTFRAVTDLYGRLPDEYDITHGAVHGPLVLHHREKRQRREVVTKLVSVALEVKNGDGTTTTHSKEFQAGTFVLRGDEQDLRTATCLLPGNL